mmetsp:Transcript_81067/g.245973  ORF Transcript_81067/g.245973 Transcript_81067/m.245973 type:complete len:104 (+) Transcript_81067:76-387(+)
MADTDNKIYVGGLAHETTKDALEAQFRQYGEIVDCVVMVDKATNRSRGFGFVTYGSAASAEAAMRAQHVIDGRPVEVSECWEKGASPKGARKGAGGMNRSSPY